VVKVSGGAVRGTMQADGDVATFQGIPYAAAPVGDLRWRDPQPVKPWTGVREADAYGPACIQEAGAEGRDALSLSEDCLHLNVWSPGWPSKKKLPVMFWIFGGGNRTGSASNPTFDGAALARRGVIVVTFDFRLGLFGYFVHPDLTAESPHHGAGNYGLKDQLAALKWVHANIARFGGDPNNITVFGQSSGSWDTGLLVASPQSNGLIARAIMESGPGYPMATLAEAEAAGQAFAANLKAPAGGAQIKFLRGLSAEEIEKAANTAAKGSAPNMGPSIDGWYMPAHSSVMFAQGREHKVPLIIGSNAQEMAGPPPDGVRKAVGDAFGIDADKALAYYGLNKGGEGKSDPLYGSVGKQVAADGLQRCGSVQMAAWHQAAGNTTYEYQFDRPLPGRPATQHAAELPFVFGNLLKTGNFGGAFSEADYRASNDIQTYWTNFAKSGDPNGAGMPVWPKFDGNVRSYLEFTLDSGPVPKEGLRREICDLYMDNVAAKMKQAGR
jgi:para-nitrobenzyl esterase